MRDLRRIFSTLILFIVLLGLTAVRHSLARPLAKSYLVFVGTYTAKTESKGIYAFEYDAATGKLTAKGVAAETPNPSWIAVHPNGKFAYAANESGKASTVSAFAIDTKNAKLTLLNQLPALGEDPCYLSFDKTGKYLFVANYSSGTIAVFPILADGRLGEHTATARDWIPTRVSAGTNKDRQEGPHAHWIEEHDFVYVADLGLDHILAYVFDAKTGTLSPSEPLPSNGIPTERAHQAISVTLSPGSGPRHVAFDRHDLYWYVLGELKSTVTVFAPETMHGFVKIQEISALPKGFSGRNDAAEIAIRPDGKFLYTSNRGDDTIAIFSIDPKQGTLKSVARVPTGGKEPRHFAITPDGQFMMVENQHSNNIIVFYVDATSGIVRQTGQSVEVPSPVNVTFVPVE